MCDLFNSVKDQSLGDQLAALVNFGGKFEVDGISSTQNTKIDFDSSTRQWNWQVCTQMGFLFIPSKNSPLTSKRLDINYWVDYCNRAFDMKMDPKKGIDEFNMLFGGTEMRGSNIFFTNGVEDAWQWAGMREITHNYTSMEAHVVDCVNCAHCVDLYTEKDSDAQDLKDTRKRIREHVSNWLKGDGFPEDNANKD